MQQEVQETSSLQQDLDDHTVAQRTPTISVGSTLQNAMQQYVLLCYEVDCIHPLCREGRPKEDTWFPGGPSLSYLPYRFQMSKVKFVKNVDRNAVGIIYS